MRIGTIQKVCKIHGLTDYAVYSLKKDMKEHDV